MRRLGTPHTGSSPGVCTGNPCRAPSSEISLNLPLVEGEVSPHGLGGQPGLGPVGGPGKFIETSKSTRVETM
jgi:hypothetical protein